MPLARSVNTKLVVTPSAVCRVVVPDTGAGLTVTLYLVMVLPPSEAGADQVTVTWPEAAVAVPIAGGSGTVAGVTELEAAEEALVPTALVAVTVKVYDVPLARLVKVKLVVTPSAVGRVVAPDTGGGLAVTLYLVMVLPPSEDGADQVTVACWFPVVAVPMIGGSGAVAGVTAEEAAETTLVPMAFVAVTVKV